MTIMVESLIRRLGNPGNYQALVFLLLACNFFPIAFNNSVMVFYAAELEFNCNMPKGWAWHSNASIPLVVSNGVTKFDNCHMYKDPENHALGNKQCIYGWEYHLTPPEWSIIAEWNLVCNEKYLVIVARLLYLGGCLVGALIIGPLAEKFGRRNMMMFCLLFQMTVGVGIFFVNHFFMFAALRAIEGILIQGLECVSFVLILELFQPSLRTLAGSTCFFVYAVAMMFLALLAYSIQHWRYIQLAISLPSVITVVYIWLVPESLRYLITSQKADEIIAVLKKFAKFTAISITENEKEEVKTACNEIKIDSNLTYDARDLMRSAILRRHTFFHCFCWLSAFLMYCSLNVFIPHLNSNKYLNFFLIGLIELLSHVIAFVAFNKFGRRRPLFILFIASGVLSIASVLVEHLGKSRSEGTAKSSLTLVILGKICITGCISGLYTFSTETFPTVARTVGIGVCAAAKIIGGIIAPLIELMGGRMLATKAIPVILICALALIAAFVVLMLPETFKKELPDFVVDSENLGKQKVVSLVVDKVINTSGAVTSNSHPLTPPIKRAASTSSINLQKEHDKEIETENTTLSNESESQVDLVVENEVKNSSHNRNVRFLGIDVLDGEQKPKKNMSVDDRRVRFSNVVHDIQHVTECAQNVTATDADITKEENASVVSTDVLPSLPVDLAAVKPAFSILKKNSNEEVEKKLIKSPYPVRKISPDKEQMPDIEVSDNEISKIVSQEETKSQMNNFEQIELNDISTVSDDVVISDAETSTLNEDETHFEIARLRKDSVFSFGEPSTSCTV